MALVLNLYEHFNKQKVQYVRHMNTYLLTVSSRDDMCVSSVVTLALRLQQHFTSLYAKTTHHRAVPEYTLVHVRHVYRLTFSSCDELHHLCVRTVSGGVVPNSGWVHACNPVLDVLMLSLPCRTSSCSTTHTEEASTSSPVTSLSWDLGNSWSVILNTTLDCNR